MQNYGGQLSHDNGAFPYSYLELSKPTGKYVYRWVLRLISRLSATGFVRYSGNACTPGLSFPYINPEHGIEQFSNFDCGLLIVNTLGNEPHRQAVMVPGEPFMNLQIRPHWESIQDYLNDMSSKYRVRNKKVLSVSESVERRFLSDLPTAEWLPACAQLLGKTLKQKTLAISPNLSEMLFNFQRVLKDRFKAWGYYHNKELIGFITAIETPQGVYAMHLGINESKSQDFSLYQRMMIDLIGWSIEGKKEFLCMGRTSTEIKSTLGATPVENSFLFYTQSRILRWLLGIYAKHIHKTKPYQIRSPFK